MKITDSIFAWEETQLCKLLCSVCRVLKLFAMVSGSYPHSDRFNVRSPLTSPFSDRYPSFCFPLFLVAVIGFSYVFGGVLF